MDKYYYLVSSLPMLLFDSDKFPNCKDFLDLCREQIERSEFVILKECTLEGIQPKANLPSIAEKWWNWESSVRIELAQLRSKKLNMDEEKHISPPLGDLFINDIVKKAFEEKSPLIAEKILNKARWDYLTEIERGHYFDLAFLVVYYLKLQLLERQACFKDDLGKIKFQEIQDNIKNKDESLENKQ